MAVFALYVPKPEELTSSIVILTIIFLVLCAIAYRMKLSVPVAAIAMTTGAALALTPDVLPLWNADLDSYGDMAREWSSTDHSDTFFAITSYMYVGRGKLVAFAGMAAALIIHAVIRGFINRKRRINGDPEMPTDTELKSF